MKYFLFCVYYFITHIACAQTEKNYLFIGTYTNQLPDTGIYVYEFNSQSGELKKVSQAQNITNPSYLTISPQGNFIYACTDTKMENSGTVTAFKFDSISGKLTFLNKQVSGGENPVYLTTDKNNAYVLVANYTAGRACVFKTNADGSLSSGIQLTSFGGSGPNKRRQDKSHVHAIVFSPDYKYVFLPDLGADKIRVCPFDGSVPGPLKNVEKLDINTAPGSGPRHFTFHPNAKFAYCIEELSGNVTAYKYKNGKLDSIQHVFSYSKLQEEYSSADIHISSDGLFLYSSNRWENENTIAVFSINQENGKLTLLGHQSTLGDHPRSFTIDPSGNFLLVANQVSNNIVVFKRNLKTGMLSPTGIEINIPNPSCLKMKRFKLN